MLDVRGQRSYTLYLLPIYIYARVAELVDALASGASVRKDVEVQVLSRAPRFRIGLLAQLELSQTANTKIAYALANLKKALEDARTLQYIKLGLLAQLARASRLHREGRGFESLTTHQTKLPSS